MSRLLTLLRRRAVTYLLGPFRFATDQAAPLASPYTEAGAVGSLTVTDASNILSVSGGTLVANGTAGATTGLHSSSSYARQAGRALLIRSPSRVDGSGLRFGWDATSGLSTAINQGVRWVPGSATAVSVFADSGSILLTHTLGAGIHHIATVMRGTGMFVCARLGDGGPWTLLWVFSTGAAAQYPRWTFPGGATPNTMASDDLRAVDLGSAFASDYGIATDRKATSANGDTLTMQANALVEHTITAATGVTQELSVRRTDDSNRWVVRMDQAGSTIKLIEIAAGVETERASTAQTWTNGQSYRIVVIAAGTTITPYVANVAKTGYASASSNQSATGVKVSHAGADLVSWPRTVSLPGV